MLNFKPSVKKQSYTYEILEDETKTYQITMTQDYKKGEEVSISYMNGKQTNVDLLGFFGFSLEHNPNDYFKVNYPSYKNSFEPDI